MNYEQNIPFYIHKFRDFPWKQRESEHYTFNVIKGSLADLEIDEIEKRQESAYAKIVKTLDLPNIDKKINYYFYPTSDQKEELMGDGWYGQSVYNENAVHAIYNEKDKVIGEHEDTHLLSLPLGLPISLFQEGLAEFMVGKSMFGNDHREVVKRGVENGISVDLSALMSQEGWLKTPDEDAEFYYSVAGSFIAWMINTLGIDKFKEIYKSLDRESSQAENIEKLEKILGQNFSEIETQWLNYVRGNNL